MTARARPAAPATLLALLLPLAAACGGAVPLDPVVPATVAVSAAPATPVPGAEVTVTAVVLGAGGIPVDTGTAVGFTAVGGTISAATPTDARGRATARLTRASAGEATVVVDVAGLPLTTRVVTFLDPGAPHAVSLAASAGVADVGAAVQLTARVTAVGPSGTGSPATPVPDGTVVTFTSSAGVVSGATATVGGQATATLSGLAAPALVFVTAAAGAAESLPVLVEFTDSTVPASVALAAAPAAGFTGDQGPVALTATVLTLSGAPVPAGTPVAFAVTAGAGALSAAGATTDAAGRAAVTLRGQAEGAVAVTATAAGGVTGTASVPFTDPSRPVALAFTASPVAGRVDGQGPVLLTATVSPADPAHGRIPDGTPVSFTITAGAGTLTAASVPTAGGVATVALGSGVEGTVTVRAAIPAGLAGSVTVPFTNPSRTAALALAAAPVAGRLDTQPSVVLTALLAPADPALGRIADGTAVTFSITSGAGTLSSLAATTAAGAASVTLTGTAEGSVTVRATSGAVGDSATVTFTNPSRPVALALSPSQASLRLDRPAAVTLTAAVTPADPVLGRIPDGTPVAFAITAGSGTLSSPTATTVGGVASVSLTSTAAGTVSVRATVGAVSGTTSVTWTDPSKPVALALSAAPSAGRLDVGPVTLVASVTPADPDAGAIPDGTPVSFAVTSGPGALSSATATTSSGVAVVTLTGLAEGTVAVRATVAGTVAGTASVAFTNPSKPVAVAVSANPPAGRLDGPGAVTVTSVITPADPALGAIPDGTPVTFAITSGAGTLSSTAAATVGGAAAVTLSSAAEGTVTVRASLAGGLAASLPVAFSNPSKPVALALSAAPSAGRLDVGPVTLVAVVTPADPALGAIADGTPVTFAVTSGAGTLSSSSAVTASGVAVVTLAGDAEGTVAVRATVAGGVAGTASVAFTNPSKPVAVAVSANPPAGRLDGPGAVTVTSVITPADPALGRIPDGTPVTFAITSGAGTLSSTAAATVGGAASVTLSSAAEGTVTVRASLAGGLTASLPVAFSNPSKPVALALTAAPSAGRLDVGPVTLVASVTPADPALGAIADGTPVTFTVTSGAGTLSSSTAATASGVAVVTLTGDAEGTVAVRATVAGSVAGTATVAFTNPSRPGAVALTAAPASGRAGGALPVVLTATVTPVDLALGTIADGTPVTFAIAAGSGTLSSATATTVGGRATVSLDAPAAGTVSVTATAGSAPAITSAPLAVTFAAQPTLVLVTVATTGTLPAGTAIGGVSAVVTTRNPAGLSLGPADVAATGNAAGAMLAANPADLSATRLALISGAGFQPGEVATLAFHVAPGTFPSAADFGVALTGPGVVDVAGETLPLAVAILGVAVQ